MRAISWGFESPSPHQLIQQLTTSFFSVVFFWGYSCVQSVLPKVARGRSGPEVSLQF